MRISDWSSYVCSSDLRSRFETAGADRFALRGRRAVADIFEARHRSAGAGADDFVPDRQLARAHRQALARIQPSVDHHDLVALVGARKTDREIVIALVVAIDARPESGMLHELGRESCGERGSQYVEIMGVAAY